jgi:hypothetical protein
MAEEEDRQAQASKDAKADPFSAAEITGRRFDR